MKKKRRNAPDKPTQAVLAPDAKDPKTGVSIPDAAHVKAARDFVDANEK